MAFTTINDPSKYFHSQLYTGTGSNTQQVTNNANSGNFAPDWLWIKNRSNSVSHGTWDTTRGASARLIPSAADAEESQSNVGSFDSNGFTMGATGDIIGTNTHTYVAWQWKANGGSRTTFTESGANPGGGRQVNTTAGFSIVDYTGTGSAGTIAHGLGAEPQVVIVKGRSVGNHWRVYHAFNSSAPATDSLKLNGDNATADHAGWWNDTAPTSSVFTVGDDDNTNEDGSTYIAYCFTPIQGYSKFGKYTGNGNADGPYQFLGFKPAWLMIKPSTAASSWYMVDNKRDPTNPTSKYLQANANSVEATDGEKEIDFLATGFKAREATGWFNDNGETYIYLAFAEHPTVSSSGVPATAR